MQIAELALKYIQATIWPGVAILTLWYLRDRIPDLLNRITSAEAPGIRLDFGEQIAEAQAAINGAEDLAEDPPEEKSPVRDAEPAGGELPSRNDPIEAGDDITDPTIRMTAHSESGQLSPFLVGNLEELLAATKRTNSVRLNLILSHARRARSNRARVQRQWGALTGGIIRAMDEIVPLEWDWGERSEIAQSQLDALHALTGSKLISEVSGAYRILARAYKELPSKVKAVDAEAFMESAEKIAFEFDNALKSMDRETFAAPRRKRMREIPMSRIRRAADTSAAENANQTS
ncbi:hypothetical protein ABT099_04455 [Streptomyces prasinus]|uniref:hypothetical protein n=1 Tax=Streptomyces prasinus TaxID=67345 RepID=UPI00332220E4